MQSFVILREIIFLEEAGSFLVLLHMEMVRQISYCGQNSHAEREEGSFLPAPDQTKTRMGEGQAEYEHPHTVTALALSGQQRY